MDLERFLTVFVVLAYNVLITLISHMHSKNIGV